MHATLLDFISYHVYMDVYNNLNGIISDTTKFAYHVIYNIYFKYIHNTYITI